MNPYLNDPRKRHNLDGHDEQRQQVEAILTRLRSRPSLKGPQTYVRYEHGRLVEYVR